MTSMAADQDAGGEGKAASSLIDDLLQGASTWGGMARDPQGEFTTPDQKQEDRKKPVADDGAADGVGTSSATLTLNTGAEMPRVGLGLWKSAKGEVEGAVVTAISAGYRLLDGAAAYGNEAEVGEAIKAALARNPGLTRDDLFVVGKCFQTHHAWRDEDGKLHKGRVHRAINKTLEDLQLDHLDLWLMHWPFAFAEEEPDWAAIGPFRDAKGTPNPKLTIRMEYMDTWNAMAEVLRAGKVRAIGVSNFTEKQIQDLMDGPSGVVPAVNQVELHPYLAQPELKAFCDSKGIQMMAYSPLGSADSYSGKSFPAVGEGPFESPLAGAPLLQNEAVGAIATRLGRTPAQVLLRWSLQSGFIPIPKSVKESRIKENFDITDGWELSDDDMKVLAQLNCGFRYGIGYEKGHYDCPNAPWF
eukprot:g4676.t1